MKKWQKQRDRARDTLAREVGFVQKPHGGRLRVALAFPNTYFVGMSSLGFQTTYRLFNDIEDVVCERVFLPPKQELQAQLATMIRARELVREPSVSVQVQKYRPFFILGEVQRPGQYAYVPGMSVLTAVSIAGGYTFRANKKRATIVRLVGTESIRGRALPETQIQPGDTINVPEAWF